MRASSYNIYVKLIEDDAYLIIQGYTGAIDKVNGAVYRYLHSEGKSGSASASTVQHLRGRGYLTERSVDEEREHVRKTAEIIHRRNLKVAGFLFAPTFSCQLRCTYCYEAPVCHKEDSLAVMTSEHVRSAYAAIDEIVERFGKRPPREVTLYGGEPLMARNRDIISEIVEEGVHRKLRFRAITNGFDLMKYEDLLGIDKIYFLQITLDGPEEIHNRRRFARNGRPTFKDICRGVQLALDRGCAVALRTNIDRSNLKGLADLNQFYMDMGWSRNPKFHPYGFTTYGKFNENLLEPMELLEASRDLIPRVKGQRSRSIRTNFGIDHCFNSLLRSRTIPLLRPIYCRSNAGAYIFGPDGHIYTCWDEVGLDEGRIGRYLPDLVWNEELSREWLSRSIANIPACLDCPYGLICGGGCPRRAKKTCGSMLKPYCHQFSELFQYLVPIIYRDQAKAIEETGRKALDENQENQDPCQETPLQ